MTQTEAASADAPEKKSPISRFGPLVVIAVIAATFVGSGAHRFLTLDSLRENYESMSVFVEQNFLTALALFIFAYIIVTAASIPGASFMSLAGGFLFGAIVGTAAVVVSATIGATIIFQVARTALGDALRERAGSVVKKLEDGFNENAFSYLLLLRLIPLFPFFVVNIAPAFFGVKTRTFFSATLIGIVPGAFAYVSAGNGLGAILRAGGDIQLSGLLTQPEILTPIIAMSILAIVPIVYQQIKKSSTEAEPRA